MSDSLHKKIDFLFDKRFCEFALTSLGKQMNIKLSNGKKSQGLFYTAHPIMGSVISKQYSNEEGLEEDSHLLETEDFVYFSIENLEKPPIIEDLDQFLRPKTEKHGNKSKKAKEMKIDGEITTKKGINNKKNLVKWEAELNTGIDITLNESSHKMDSWNQFEANKERFGIDFHYIEEDYTTKLDISKVDNILKKKAERIEREMLNENIEDRHILEERGKVELSEDYDEEKKFSAVIGSGRYVEPNKDMDIKFKPCPLKFVNKKKEIDKTQEGEKKNIAENFGKKDDNINKPKENKDIYIEKPPNLEKFQENIEIKTFSQENKDYNLEQQSIDRLDSSEKISLKNKKLAEKSLKLNSVSFFAGNKGNSNVAISEFKPANEKMIQNNDKTIISEKPTEKVTPIIEKASPIIEKLINKQNLNTVINIPTNEKLEVKEEKITNLSKPPVDQFKLYSGDVHLSIKFKCKNTSQDSSHNSKKNFRTALLENWERFRESYNVTSSDGTWKKIKLESKEVEKKVIIQTETKPIITHPNIVTPTPIYQPTVQNSFYPSQNLMYPPIPMGINNVGPPTNYQYVNNMYAPPMQNYGYNMGYDYGYQGAGYINPMMGQQPPNNMKFYQNKK